eukprot:27041-Pleurochrysis_carterae.AAC.1
MLNAKAKEQASISASRQAMQKSKMDGQRRMRDQKERVKGIKKIGKHMESATKRQSDRRAMTEREGKRKKEREREGEGGRKKEREREREREQKGEKKTGTERARE